MGKKESSICKHELFNQWLHLRVIQRPPPSSIPATYLMVKEQEGDYQSTKKKLYKRFEDNHYGTWLKYPLETDLFDISNEK